jgi:hypothetical protein
MEQQYIKWFLELVSQEYNGRIKELNSNINLIGDLE